MSKILLGITVDDKIYEEYASHKYVMATNNRNGEGTQLSTIRSMPQRFTRRQTILLKV